MFGPIFTFNLFICPFILICLHVLQGRECLGLFLRLICLLVVLSLMCLHVLQGLECLDLFLPLLCLHVQQRLTCLGLFLLLLCLHVRRRLNSFVLRVSKLTVYPRVRTLTSSPPFSHRVVNVFCAVNSIRYTCKQYGNS